MVAIAGTHALAQELAVAEIKLPALRIQGQPARAHTQGLEVADGKFYVTARREDVRPKQALLLRTDRYGAEWNAWDITPLDVQGAVTTLDHPGGMQSDGKRLWIPVAESKRNGRSIIRAFQLNELVAGRPLKSDFEFPVNDHIGAVAVSAKHELLLGANWDTEKVHVWDFKGHLQRTLSGAELKLRELGAVAGPDGRAGVTVQDWKFSGDRLFASGLFRAPGSASKSPASRVAWFSKILQSDFQKQAVKLPLRNGTELAREAMMISEGAIYFLPEDLGATNRLFRVVLADLMKHADAR